MSKFNVTITLRLEKTIDDKLERLSLEKGIKKSEYIRQALLAKMNEDVLVEIN